MHPIRPRATMFIFVVLFVSSVDYAFSQTIRVERLLDSPIIRPEMDGRMGSNVTVHDTIATAAGAL